MHKVQVTPIIGLPQFDGWAQVITSQSGHAVWSLAISGQHAGNVGRDVVDLITTTNYSTAEELYSLFQEILKDTQEKLCQLSGTCLMIDGDKSVYCGYQGGITLKRGEKVGSLLNTQDEIKILIGESQKEDLYILATDQAEQFLEEIKQKLSQGYDSDTIVTSITPGMRLEENTARSALAFVTREEAKVDLVNPDVLVSPDNLVSSDGEGGEVKTTAEEDQTDPDFGFLADFDLDEKLVDTSSESRDTKGMEDESESKADQSESSLFPFTTSLTNPNFGEKSAAMSASTAMSAKGQVYLKKIKEILFILGAKVVELVKLLVEKAPVLLEKIKQKQWLRKPFSGDVYVTRSSTRKIIRLVLPVLILVVLVGGFWWYRSYTNSQQVAQAQEQVEPITRKLDEVRGQVESDPITAREEANQLTQELQAVLDSFQGKKAAISYIEGELQQAQEFLDSISGQEELNQLPVFFDLRSEQSDFVATKVGFFENQAVLFDGGKKQLILLNLTNKEVTTASAESLPEIVDIATRDINDTVWFLAEGIHQFKPDIQTTITKEINQEEANQTSTMIASFGDAIYTLDPEERTIFRYGSEDGEFVDATRWLRAGQGIDLAEVSSFVIDGDIWLTTKAGEVVRLRSGNRQEFTITGLAKAFSSPLILFTTDEIEDLYILESAAQRIVVLNKQGEFLREISSSSLASATSLIVKPDLNKIFAMSGSIIFEINL